MGLKPRNENEVIYYSDWPKWIKNLSTFFGLIGGIGSVVFAYLVSVFYGRNIDSEAAAIEFSQMRLLGVYLSGTAMIVIFSILIGNLFQVLAGLIIKIKIGKRDWALLVHANLIWLSVVGFLKILIIYYRHYPPINYSGEIIVIFFGSVLSGFVVALGGAVLIGVATKKGMFNKI